MVCLGSHHGRVDTQTDPATHMPIVQSLQGCQRTVNDRAVIEWHYAFDPSGAFGITVIARLPWNTFDSILCVMRPQAEGQIATTFVATSCQEQQSVVSRDLQSALLLCCSAALYALYTQSRLHNSRVSLVYRTVEFPSFIGASCST